MNRKIRRVLGSGLALLAFGIVASDATARTNRALLVGVTKYDNLPETDWLNGPANDAQLVRDYLIANPVSPFAKENITLIASDVEGAQKPTRATIMQAFDDLAASAQPGDFIFIQLSGHGSQQPAANLKTEIDGKDEIFLPMDIGKIDMATKTVANAIVDDEIGQKLDAIRDKGAFVWLVIDACHSGTATRALGSNPKERQRKLSPAALGVTADLFPKVEATRSLNPDADPERENALGVTDSDGASDGKRGGLVAFFAAQTVETAPELPLPENDPDAKTLGLFTFTMLQRLSANPAVSYRQLGQGILQQYTALSRIKPTPLFEGDLDAPVFGVKGDDPVMQWKVAVKDGVVQLPAGRLNRVEPGTKLAILPGPQSQMEDALGYLDVRSATNMTSQLLPAAFRERSAMPLDAIPADAYARVAENAVSFEMKVALPDAASHPEEAAKIAAALETIANNRGTPLKLKLVGAGQPADIRLVVASEADIGGGSSAAEQRVWFLPPSGEVSLAPTRRPPSLGLADEKALVRDVSSYLVRMSRAMNLSRLAGAESGIRGVKAEFLIARQCVPENEDDAPILDKGFELIEAGKVPVMAPNDCVLFRAENASNRPVDLNILHIGSDYKITVVEGEYGEVVFPVRMNAGAKVPDTLLFAVDEAGRMGGERLIAVLSGVAPQSEVLDLTYMAQEATRSASAGVQPQDDFASILADIAAPPATRALKSFGGAAQSRGEGGAMLVFPIETTEVAE
jgi:hypothetical protein